MARVIVIVGLMLAITTAMFALTRRSAVAPGEAAGTTVHLGPPPADDKIDDTVSLTSAEPRSPASVKTPATTQDVASGRVPGAAPTFGAAGVDHKGNASFTGTAAAGDSVTLLLDGKTLGAAKADDKGSWSIAFKAPSKEAHLQVSAQGKDGSVVIGLERAVIRPSVTPGGLPRVMLKAAVETSTTPTETSATIAEAKTGLIVENVTGGGDGRATLTGKADAGATVKASINGKPAGETQVAADGAWTLAASNQSRKEANSLRLELVDKTGATLDQTSVPYKITAQNVVAADPKLATEFSSVLTSKPSARPKRVTSRKAKRTQEVASLVEPTSAVEEPRAPRIIKVRRGDSLWRISRRHLGNGKKWAAFYKANKAKIDNPDLIYPGQVLILPG